MPEPGPVQLALWREPPEEELRRRLALLGLREADRVRLHSNRTVMVSFSRRGGLRLHRGYAFAPDRVLEAIVRFVRPGTPAGLRQAARRELLAYPVEAHAPPREPRRAAPERPRPGDLVLLHRLEELHRRLNREHFGGALGAIPVRISGRMRTRLGELAVHAATGRPLEIALSRRHLRRHPWAEVEHTMLHEMVHQWQAETGRPVDHGREFRRKAREVGIRPAATRTIDVLRRDLSAGA